MIIGEYVSQHCFNTNIEFDTKIASDFMKAFDEEQDRILRNVCDITVKQNDKSIYDIRDKMKKIMMDKVGIFRTGSELQSAYEELQELLKQSDGVYIRTNTKSANTLFV